jgi:hypothetical protein
MTDLASLLLLGSLQGEPPAAAPAEPAFRLELALDLWLPRLEGEFNDNGAKVDVRDVDVHDTEPSFAGALRVIRDRVQVELRGFSFRTEGNTVADTAFTLGGVTVDAGDRFDSSFSWWSAGAEVSYEVLRPHHDGPNNTDFALFVLGSLDFQSVTRDITNITAPASTDAIEAFAVAEFGGGMRLRFDTGRSFPLCKAMEISAKAAAGASIPLDDGDLGGAARVEATFTGFFDEHTAVYLGYRLVGASLTGEEMEMTTSLQGLVAGFRYEF